MTLRISAWIGLVMAVMIGGAAQGQNTTEMRIGVVNVARLLEQAPQAQQAMSQLQQEFAPRQQNIAALQRTLAEKQETYERDGQVMGEAERLSLEREIRDQQRDLEREKNDYLEDLNIRRNEKLGALQRDLLQQVQAHARNAGYDLVVGDVLYYSSAIDITDEVLRGLEESFSSNAAASSGPSAP